MPPERVSPEKNEDYLIKSYWDERYKHEESFEWCKGFSEVEHLITKFVRKEDKILIIGCGNSLLGPDMYNAGYKDITNIDFSEVVIEKMKTNHPNQKWIVMDMTKLTNREEKEFFEHNTFDVVIEKGSIDVLFVKEKSPWSASEETEINVKNTVDGISQVLKPGGRFLSITFAQPHFRLKYYDKQEYDWSIQQETYGDMFHFFFYVATKN